MAGRPGYLTLPIFSVLAAIGYVYYTTVFVAVARWLGLATAAGVANASAFTALAAACVATYAVAVCRDPGRVPPDFVPDVEDAESTVHEIKRKGGDLRYCQKCCHYKPPRAHHCRVCKRCVLKMVLPVVFLRCHPSICSLPSHFHQLHICRTITVFGLITVLGMKTTRFSWSLYCML